MEDHSTALSHVAVLAVSVYCYRGRYFYDSACYGLLAANSILGIWRYGNPYYGQKSKQVYDFLTVAKDIFVLPLIATEMYFQSSFQTKLGYVHLILPLIPFVFYMDNKEYESKADVVVSLCGASLAVVSGLQQKWWGIATAIAFLGGYFAIRKEGRIFYIPAIDLYNYNLCFFAYFSLRAVTQG